MSTITEERSAAVALGGAEFRTIGHELVDRIADFIDGVSDLPVARALSPRGLRPLLPAGGMPRAGADALELFREVLPRLIETSTLNSHPRFFGYISGCPAPAGILADLAASALNPNCGAWILSPLASEIEKQTIAWLSELLDFPCGSGLLVSGGNQANIVCFQAARAAAAPEARTRGLRGLPESLVGYGSTETHTWINKAADLCGLGSEAMRMIAVDDEYRMDADQLATRLEQDIAAGLKPFIVVATAGTVATGAIDPIERIAEICQRHEVWLHIDGAYGAPAAMLPDAPADLRAVRSGDSIAIDPHKWLYAPMEAGAALVRDAAALSNAFAYRPPYYKFDGSADDPRTNFYELGPQNSRGFRAFKVWLTLRQVGRAAYEEMIGEDIALSRLMYETADTHPELEALTQSLSIATFRFVPADLRARRDQPEVAKYLNELNTALVGELQAGGEVFVSNAVLNGRYALRACIVNFRTTRADAIATPEIAARVGQRIDRTVRPDSIARTSTSVTAP